MRLGPETALPAAVARPTYDRAAQGVGIVHFGIGAFLRAHQAWYTERAMDAGDRDWAICGVSLRSPDVAQQLNPQSGLYTLTERGAAGEASRLIGAVCEVLVAGPDHAKVLARIAAPHCHVVMFTVTEKGYCRRADGSLDPDLAAQGFYPLLAEAMATRAENGLPGLTLLSCDNLADNGVTDGSSDASVYLRSMAATPSELISRATGPAGVNADSRAHTPSISDDGSRIIFSSDATNLGPAPDYYGVYLRDRASSTTSLVSARNSYAVEGLISGDGNVTSWFENGGATADSDSSLGSIFSRKLPSGSGSAVGGVGISKPGGSCRRHNTSASRRTCSR